MNRNEYPPLPKAEEDALITRAMHGDAQAAAEMNARYRGLIIRESRASYLRNAALSADAENIAALAFVEALHDYDPQHGAPFAAFAKTRIHTALYTEFRRKRRHWQRTRDAPAHRAGEEDPVPSLFQRSYPAPHRGPARHIRRGSEQEQGEPSAKTARGSGCSSCNAV